MNAYASTHIDSFEKLLLNIREALAYMMDHRSKKRPSLNVVHFEPTPRRQDIEDGRACSFRVKIAAGNKFDLIAVDSTDTKEAIIKQAHEAKVFKPTISPDDNPATTPGLADRLYRLFRRFFKHLKKVARRYSHIRARRKTNRYVRMHTHASAAR